MHFLPKALPRSNAAFNAPLMIDSANIGRVAGVPVRNVSPAANAGDLLRRMVATERNLRPVGSTVRTAVGWAPMRTRPAGAERTAASAAVVSSRAFSTAAARRTPAQPQ